MIHHCLIASALCMERSNISLTMEAKQSSWRFVGVQNGDVSFQDINQI